MRDRDKMTVKYVAANTSALEKPERLVPDTDFMTPIRNIIVGQLLLAFEIVISLR